MKGSRFKVQGSRKRKRVPWNSLDARRSTLDAGFVLIEAVVASGIIAVILAGLVSALILSLRAAVGDTAQVQATFLAEEGLEAVRILRDTSWASDVASHTSGVNFYLAFDGTTWQATTTDLYIDKKFQRTVQLSDVYRNGNQDIVASGGALDSNTKEVTISVSWLDNGATTTRSLSAYLTNMFNN